MAGAERAQRSAIDKALDTSVKQQDHRMVRYLTCHFGASTARQERMPPRLNRETLPASPGHFVNPTDTSGQAVLVSAVDPQVSDTFSEAVTRICPFCGGHYPQADLFEYCCVVACEDCAGHRMPCPMCFVCTRARGRLVDAAGERKAADISEHHRPPIMILFDLNGVLMHRPREGQQLPDVPGEFRLPAARGNSKQFFMYASAETPQLLRDLHEAAKHGTCSWGFYTTIKHFNALRIVQCLLRSADFSFIQEVSGSYLIEYSFDGEIGHAWFFPQESMEKDTGADALQYANTLHKQDLPQATVVDLACSAIGVHAASKHRTVIVLGNARKAKHCRSMCFLVRDYDGPAAGRGDDKRMTRLSRLLHIGVKQGSLTTTLCNANRYFVKVKAVETCLAFAEGFASELSERIVGYLHEDPLGESPGDFC